MSTNWLNDVIGNSPAKRHVVWAGELEFKSATETDRVGRTVQFLLRRPPDQLNSAHPFSAHTRRRRGHAGTIFTMSLEPIGQGRAMCGGAMLLNWSSSPKGETVTFLINYDSEHHPFMGCKRAAKDVEPSRWMAVFIEEDDTSAPVDQAQRAAAEQALTLRKPKRRVKNSNLARLFTKDSKFWKFMTEVHGYHVTDEYEADVALKAHLNIDSKADLDRLDGVDADSCDWSQFRNEYVEWQMETYGPDALHR